MAENISNSDPASRFERAKLYVDGDKEKAKKMVEGKFKDVTVLKVSFNAEDINIKGLICIFINMEKNSLKDYYVVATKGNSLGSDTTHQPWQEYIYNIFKIMYSEDNVVNTTGKLKSELEREFTPALVSVLIEKLLANDTASLVLHFEKIISFVLKSHQLNINVVTEKTSSLHADEAIENIKSSIGNSANAKEKENEQAEVNVSEKPSIVAQKDKELYDQGHRIIDCKLVLSPVKGKFVSNLDKGDIVKIRIKGNTSQDMNIAERLGWLKDGKMMPGEARIHSRTKVDDGNLIYVQIGTNLFGKILEEEEVRVYVSNHDNKPNKKQGNLGKTLFIWFLVILVIVGIIGVMIMINQ